MIYLDSNIIKYISIQADSLYIKLPNKPIQFFPLSTYPYSTAHISDLLINFDNSEDKKGKVKPDLDKIEALSRNFYISLSFGNENVEVNQSKPIEIFYDYFREQHSKDSPNFKEIIYNLGINTEELATEFETIKSIAMENKDKIGIPLMGLEYSKTYSDWLENIHRLTPEFMKSKDYIRESRSQLEKGLVEFKKAKLIKGNFSPIDMISLISKDFPEQWVSYIDSYFGNKSSPTRCVMYNDMSSWFMLLDLFGIGRDELKSMEVMRNMVGDINHIFYGSFFKAFITNDKRLKMKADRIYKIFNRETVAYLPDAFLSLGEERINELVNS